MTTPYMLPSLSGQSLSVDVAMRQPSIITKQIAKLVDSQLILQHFVTGIGQPVTGGGMVYSVMTKEDLYTTRDAEQVGIGDEFPILEGSPLEPKVALVEKWGGKFKVPDEVRIRNNLSYLNGKMNQLANTIARKLNERLMLKVELAIAERGGAGVIVGSNWDPTVLVTVGPEADITPNVDRPTADFAAAQLAADMDEMGVVLDTLVVNSQQAFALKVAYGERLQQVLDSAGLTLVSHPRVTAGTAYVLKKGAVGTVGFERMGIETWDDREVQSTWYQNFIVPAIAIDRPEAMFKLTGLAG
jgi:hypothetical protein